MVRAIHRPPVDVSSFLPKEILHHQDEEKKLRNKFATGKYSVAITEGENEGTLPPYLGLISCFSFSLKEKNNDGFKGDTALVACPLRYDPNNLLRTMDPSSLFLTELGKDSAGSNNSNNSSNVGIQQDQVAMVATLAKFTSNFNKEHPNILNRIGEVLNTENVIIAGGSVLRALTADTTIRTGGKLWGNVSDIDMFVFGVTKEEANRIVRRIFLTLAVNNERWVIVRTRGVINIHNAETKIQIVLRIYDTATEVLIGFDLDCCCCLYNGRDVKVSHRFVSALTSGVNVLNSIHSWPNKPCTYFCFILRFTFLSFIVLL